MPQRYFFCESLSLVIVRSSLFILLKAKMNNEERTLNNSQWSWSMKRAILLSGFVLVFVGRPLLGDESPKTLKVSDQFAENSLKNYEIEGEVTWKKGQLTLAPDASLLRKVELGYHAEARLILRRPKGEKEIGLSVNFRGKPPPPVLLYGNRSLSGVVMVNCTQNTALLTNWRPDHNEQVAVRSLKTNELQDWILRVQARHGVIRCKIWLSQAAEPADWHSALFSGEAFWEPVAIRIRCSKLGPCIITAFDTFGTPPRMPLSAEKQKKAEQAARLNGQATSSFRKGGFGQQAVLMSKEALELSKEAWGDNHPACAICWNNMGIALEDLGKLDDSISCFKEALAISEKFFGRDHVFVSKYLTGLGVREWQMGRYREARQLYQESLRIRLKLQGPDHVQSAENFNNLGVLFTAMGEYSLARQHLERALAIRRHTLGEQHFSTAECWNNLASLNQARGDYAAARKQFEKALDIATRAFGPNSPFVLLTQNNLATVLRHMGDLESARAAYEKIIASLKKVVPDDHPFVALTLANYAGVLWQFNKAGSKEYYEKALVIYKNLKQEKHPNTALIFESLGTILDQEGKDKLAQKYFQDALNLRREVLAPDHPDIARTSMALFEAALRKKDNAAAAKFVKEALAIWEKGLGDHPFTANAVGSLGLLESMQDRDEDAWRDLRASAAMLARLTQRLLTASAERDHAALTEEGRFRLYQLLGLVERNRSLAGDHALGLMEVLLDWHAASERTLVLRREAVAVAGNPKALALYDDLKLARHQLAQAFIRGPTDPSTDKHRQLLKKLQTQRDDLERQLADQIEDFGKLHQDRKVTLKAVAGKLNPNTALISFVKFPHLIGATKFGAPHYAGLILWREEGKPQGRVVFLGEAEAIDKAIHAWRQTVQRGLVEAARDAELRERLWEPVAKALPRKTTKLYLAPDGELALVPFEAIRMAGGKFLVEQLAISYLSSGRDLLASSRPKQKGGLALILADPNYEATGEKPPTGPGPDLALQVGDGKLRSLAGEFKRLAGFAREADAAAKLLGGRAGWQVKSLRGDHASEENLAAVARPRLLYCISHGFFLPDLVRPVGDGRLRELELVNTALGGRKLPPLDTDPRLRSGLALAGANRWKMRLEQGKSDGWLTAMEVENLDLWGTDLVVLSACETGRGEIQVGEGVLGLRRAFQLAGAQTVLASLWKVPDAETEKLMARFLQKWLESAGEAEALREAQLRLIQVLRDSPDPRLRQAPPLYWAGFICHGQAK
jgi:CHAT domain-containing protein/Tfp pilus assembly protein PilF